MGFARRQHMTAMGDDPCALLVDSSVRAVCFLFFYLFVDVDARGTCTAVVATLRYCVVVCTDTTWRQNFLVWC